MTNYHSIDLQITDPRLGQEWPLPKYATDGSVAMDLCACIDSPLTLKEGECKLISSGIAIDIKDPNIMAIIVPRSGMGHKGLVVGNNVGIIDTDYRGTLYISAVNRNQVQHEAVENLPTAEEEYLNQWQTISLKQVDCSITIQPGERIAQLIFVPIIKVKYNVVEKLEITSRGTGGFGSTGKI